MWGKLERLGRMAEMRVREVCRDFCKDFGIGGYAGPLAMS